MYDIIDVLKNTIPRDFFSWGELFAAIPKGTKSKAALYGLVHRSIAQGHLIQLRRGFYALGDKHRRKNINHFELASVFYGSAYVSFESALSFHGLIPEAVRITQAASLLRTCAFETPFGQFSFHRIPAHPFFMGVKREAISKEGAFLIASPERALLDLVYKKKLKWQGMEFLTEGFRLDEDFLKQFSADLLLTYANAIGGSYVRSFARELIKELTHVPRHHKRTTSRIRPEQ